MIILAIAMWLVTAWFVWDLAFGNRDEEQMKELIAEQDKRHKEFLDNLNKNVTEEA